MKFASNVLRPWERPKKEVSLTDAESEKDQGAFETDSDDKRKNVCVA